MKKKVVVLVVVGMLLVVFQAWGAEPASPDKKIDINKMTCKELMSGDDTDREVGIAFFHGFMAGKNDNNMVDVKKVSALTDMVKDYCLSNPPSTVMNAFKKSAK